MIRGTVLAVLIVATLVACRDEELHPRRASDAGVLVCGDGRADPGEECDGADLRGSSCASLGFDEGSVSCDPHCRVVIAACVKLCGNGQVDPGETCDGTAGPLACAEWGYKLCTNACTIDALHCRADAFQLGPPVFQPQGGPAIVADLAPPGAGELVIPDAQLRQLQLYEYKLFRGFVEGSSIWRTDGVVPMAPIAADLDGDGRTDLAALNTDGTADRYLYVPPGQPLPDGGAPSTAGQYAVQRLLDAPAVSCRMLEWIGAIERADRASDGLAVLACPTSTLRPTFDGVLIHPGGPVPALASWIPQPGTLAAALADFDADGVADLLLARDQAVIVRAGPSFATPSNPLTLDSSPSRIAAGDLDGDGDADVVITTSGAVKILENMATLLQERWSFAASVAYGVAVRDLDLDGRADVLWLADGKVEVLRNLGGFAFTSRAAATGSGTPLSLSLGDFEGDGDADIAATVVDPSGGARTATYLLENLVR